MKWNIKKFPSFEIQISARSEIAVRAVIDDKKTLNIIFQNFPLTETPWKTY